MNKKISMFIVLSLVPFIEITYAQLGSLIPVFQSFMRRSSRQEVCPPDPNQLLKISPPLANCREAAKEGLGRKHPFQNLNTSEILDYYGYPFQVYTTTTADNYILTVHRVLGPPNTSGNTEGKQAVYLQHGLLQASDGWLMQYGTRNFVYKLTDAGYDVWLGSARGTIYSNAHLTLDPDELKYWDYSFHELGVYDLPANINLILSETGQEKIFYIGHSMGTSSYLVAMSEIPELNDKIIAGFLLSPVAFMGHFSGSARLVLPYMEELYAILNPLLKGRIPFRQVIETADISLTLGDLCAPTALRCGVCDNTLFLLFGYNADQLNTTDLPYILAKAANSMPGKVLVHYGQLIRACQFQKFDYGLTRNMELYGSYDPPIYEVGNIRAPTYFYYGDGDNLVPPIDVQLLADQFSPGVLRGNFRVEEDFFNHIDFVLAKDADILLYNRVIKEMEMFR